MFKKKTTFVIGAGASCELGLPSGEGLKTQIIDLLSPSRDNHYGFSASSMQQSMAALLKQKLSNKWQDMQPYINAAEKIRRGLPLAMSIDNYLHTHQDDEHLVAVGKMAIGLSILSSEGDCHLFGRNYYSSLLTESRERTPDLSGEHLAESWYPSFAKILMSQVQVRDIAAAFKNVRFIIFNYDRCFEQYLWLALQSYFNIDGNTAASVLSEVEFLHPYGSLGPLPWQRVDGDTLELGQHRLDDPWVFADRIRTFTESVNDDVADAVQKVMTEAQTIVVLGFGYLDQNVQLITPHTVMAARMALSTAYGVSPYDQDVMMTVLRSWMRDHGGTCRTAPGSCRQLFDNFHMTLNLG